MQSNWFSFSWKASFIFLMQSNWFSSSWKATTPLWFTFSNNGSSESDHRKCLLHHPFCEAKSKLLVQNTALKKSVQRALAFVDLGDVEEVWETLKPTRLTDLHDFIYFYISAPVLVPGSSTVSQNPRRPGVISFDCSLLETSILPLLSDPKAPPWDFHTTSTVWS